MAVFRGLGCVGDKVLERLSVILNNNIRKSDILARWGGEEFVIAFYDTNLELSEHIAEKIRKSVEEDTVLYSLVSYKVTSSFGLTMLKETDSVTSMFQRLDEALYKAKEMGRNQVNIF